MAWALEDARSSAGHLQNAVEGHLGADDHVEKHIHWKHYTAKGGVVVFGLFVSRNVSTRQNLLPGLAPLCVFTEKQGAQGALERSFHL